MIKFLKAFLVAAFSTKCIHEFKNDEVANLQIDPICVHCNQKMSEITAGKVRISLT